MAQTFYALVAVFSFSLLGLTMHRQTADTERHAIEAEVEAAALDLALLWGNKVKALAFDEADVDATTIRPVANVDGLTPVAAFGPDATEATLADYDDVDDMHGLTVQVEQPLGNGIYVFDVHVAVRYADPLDFERTGVAGPTTAKMVTLTIADQGTDLSQPDPAGRHVQLALPVTSVKRHIHW
ncbi:MAG: hypothetical protein AAGF99_03100 [Bacteroidota bacterium]